MKKHLLLITFLILISGGSSIFAQSPPPPPPPLIYSAPAKSELKEFVSEDKTFQITFPGVPKIAKEKINDGNFTGYSVYRQGSNSIVNTVDYDFEVEGQSEKVFENIRASFLQISKTTIEAEKDIEVDNVSGKEFDVLQDYNYQKIRILIVGKRIYELRNDVTNWHILSKFNKEKVAEFEEETKRFFASFKILKSPDDVLQPPGDFLGTSTETSYKNTFLNFTFEFPKDWHQRKYAEIKNNLESALEKLTTPEMQNSKAFQESVKSEVLIFGVSQRNKGVDRGANLVIGVTRQPNPQALSKDVVAETKKIILLNPKNKVLKEIENIRLNGAEFSTATFQTDVEGLNINQKVLTTMQKGYSITFVLSYLNDESLRSLEKIVKTINFNDAKLK